MSDELRAALRAPTREVLDDPRESAYYNARTCICGEDASAHIHPGCDGFDPDWEAIRFRENVARPTPGPEAGERVEADHRLIGYIVVRPNPNLGSGWSIVDRTLWVTPANAIEWADAEIGEGKYRLARCVVLTWPIIHNGETTGDDGR